MCTVSMTMEETLILFGRRQTRFPAKASRQAVLVWRKFVHAGAQTFGTPQEAGWSSSTAQLQYVPRDEADAVVTSNHVQVDRAIGQSINQSIRTELPSSAASSTSAATARGIWLRRTPSWTSGLATVGMVYNQAGLVGSYSRSGVGP